LVRSKWFPVAIDNHGRNLVISLWPGDKATVKWSGDIVAHPTPQKIPSTNIRWKSSRLDFTGSRLHHPHIIFQRAKLSTRSIIHLC
jgi:hypothetical protein